MQLNTYENQVQEYIKQRCREHVKLQEKRLGRQISFDYRFEHTRTAVGIADNLAKHLGIDPALARITAWLHDIAKCWDPRFDEDINRTRARNHGIHGGEEAAKYLLSIGFDENLTKQVRQAIEAHVGFFKNYILDEPLDGLLWDADKLSKISPAGVLHHLCGTMAMENKQLDLEKYFTDLEIDWRQGIRDSLNTETAREWANLELKATALLQKQIFTALRGNPPD